MNDEILQIAKYLKNKINAGEGVDEYNWQEIIYVCDELLRINSLEPVGYIMESSFDNIKEYGYTHLNEERSEKINIPLYKLD
ncbi:MULTISPECIES: hypothetical protein [Enterobacterales]|uniref:hypothetical protein n=1 Tax=Enterobacterales TaxID=91347 RepID=UPI00159A9435|nr:hypothetical protein [Klebsiella pneumoniae]MBU0049629.1 hypothetical protein [Klebsiella pneumoniae]QKJ47492.1 hypothetical protein G9394_03395 [Proteus vulgaris]